MEKGQEEESWRKGRAIISQNLTKPGIQTRVDVTRIQS